MKNDRFHFLTSPVYTIYGNNRICVAYTHIHNSSQPAFAHTQCLFVILFCSYMHAFTILLPGPFLCAVHTTDSRIVNHIITNNYYVIYTFFLYRLNVFVHHLFLCVCFFLLCSLSFVFLLSFSIILVFSTDVCVAIRLGRACSIQVNNCYCSLDTRNQYDNVISYIFKKY